MRRLVLPLAMIAALVPGCKGMGALAYGLAKTGGAVARAAPIVLRGVGRSLPVALRVTEAVAEISLASPHVTYEVETLPPPYPSSTFYGPSTFYGAEPSSEPPAPPDPCGACPRTVDCGACTGFAGYACMTTLPTDPARCESSAPPDAEPLSSAPAATDATPR